MEQKDLFEEIEKPKRSPLASEEILSARNETIEKLTKQILALGQCVVCGELDHQDGVRKDDKFYCEGCLK